MSDPNDNGFDEYKQLILRTLERLEKGQESLAKEMRDGHLQVVTEVSALKVKAGVWGAIAGAIPAGIAIVWNLLK